MTDPSRARAAGPLESFAAGFAAELARQGYTANSAGLQMGLFAHIGRWLGAERLEVDWLTSEAVERFCESPRADGYTSHLTARALEPLVVYLRGLGVAPSASVATPEGPVEELLGRLVLPAGSSLLIG